MSSEIVVLTDRQTKDFANSNELVTEDNAAREFATLYGTRLRFDHDVGSWFAFDGFTWRQNRTGLALHWSRELARDLARRHPDKVRYTASKVAFAAGVERFARVDPVFAVTSDNWDKDPLLLGTPAGTVDLKSGTMRSSDPADGITRSTAVAPAVSPDCPIWLRFLDETFGGDRDLIAFLQRFFGYSLTGDVREHALIFGYGGGGNGKSVTVNTIRGILADYAAVAPMDSFVASKGEKHSTDMAMLRGARFVTASETEEGKPWAESRIKSLTGGDPVSARFMRQDNFTYNPAFKLFIVGNHRPVLRNVDDAARRRFNIVGFHNRPANPDPELETKLRSEWPSILRWMIQGCLDWQQQGLLRPTAVIDATAEYFAAQDMIGQWLEQECDAEVGNNLKTEASGNLFSSWSAFARAAGEPSGSQKAFSDSLQLRGFERHKGTGGIRQFRGLRLKGAASGN